MKTPKKMLRVSKINAWLRAYLDESNPSTFLNKAGSARAAGYKTTNVHSLKAIGHQNFTKLSIQISAWLDESGLSEAALKLKLVYLLEGKQTSFHKVKGAVAGALPPGWRIVTTSGAYIQEGEDGTTMFTADETLLAVDLENLELQRRTLDMAIKVKGMYAADRIVFPNKKGEPQEVGVLSNIDMAARLLFLLDKAKRRKELHDSGGGKDQ